MISRDDTMLLIVDVQEKLMPVIYCNSEVSGNVSVLAEGAALLGVPVVCTEQYPERLGETIDAVQRHLNVEKISKTTFSCCGVEEFNTTLKSLGRKNILVVGVEAHVCVYQTVMGLLEQDYQPYVVVDAISSRVRYNKDVAVKRMLAEGAKATTVEMTLFELLGKGEGDAFKKILKLIK